MPWLIGLAALLWAFIAGLSIALVLFGISMGAAWLFIFGDDPWPDWFWPVQN